MKVSDAAARAQVVERAIVEERARSGIRINQARVGTLYGWCLLGEVLGRTGRPEWLVPVPFLAAAGSLAVALHVVTRRHPSAARYLWLTTPLLDVPLIWLVQSTFLDVSIRPFGVAIFTVGIVTSLVFIAQLSFDWRAIAGTLIGGIGCAAYLLHKAQLPIPNWLSAVLLLSWSAAIATFASSRTRRLVAAVASARATHEIELEQTVTQRTAELADRNRELEDALRSLERAQTDLLRAERLASVSTLVSGVAHELNNPINFIANNVEPLERHLSAIARATANAPRSEAAQLDFIVTDLHAIARDIREGSRRVRLIVGDLQRLTANAERNFEEVDLAVVARQTKAMLGARLREGVTIAIDADDAVPIRAHAGALEQVLVNLVDNAIRAVAEKGTIKIRIATAAKETRISVSDDGCGMSATEQARAFEPFFTTRKAGDGAGLGLAVVARIVDAHGGKLGITSELGKGTTITIVLP